MQSRGFTTAELVKSHFQPSLKDMTHPLKLIKWKRHVKDWLMHFKRRKICIYADFDLDGTSGLALMLKGLEDLDLTIWCITSPRGSPKDMGCILTSLKKWQKQKCFCYGYR